MQLDGVFYCYLKTFSSPVVVLLPPLGAAISLSTMLSTNPLFLKSVKLVISIEEKLICCQKTPDEFHIDQTAQSLYESLAHVNNLNWNSFLVLSDMLKANLLMS